MKLRREPAFYAVLLLFFVSGFSALLYQVVWQRLLGCFAGVDVYSVTITVAAFMAGLGCGSLAGGYVADRVGETSRLAIFCIAEFSIAIFALASKALYYDLLYVRCSWLAGSPLLLPLTLFLTLLWPTFWMGVTLPILSRTFTARIESAAAVIGCLYGINTLGAAVGAFATGWILFRWWSFPDVLRAGAALNFISAVGAAIIWLRLRQRAPRVEPAPADNVAGRAERAFPFAIWLVVYAMSGFLALALEIVWFRFLSVLQKSTSFTFATLLAIYLAGFAAGVLAGIPLARRARAPAAWFFGLQAGVTLYAGLSLTLLLRIVDKAALLQPLWAYLQEYEPLSPADVLPYFRTWLSGAALAEPARDAARLLWTTYGAVPLMLIAPATLLMGISFPLLQQAVQRNAAVIGRRVGWLQAMNIAGAMLGAIIVGWLALSWLGTAETLRAIVVLGGGFALLAVWQITGSRTWRAVGIVLAAALAVFAAGAVPSQSKLWAKVHGSAPDQIVFGEDNSGVSVLKPTSGSTSVFTNGLGQSWLPYGSVHTQIGMLGALLHPAPRDVAVIGLGSGDTAFALGGSPHTKRITCIEIVRPQKQTLVAVAPRLSYPALDSLLRDRRYEWVFGDGRAYIQQAGRTFDVIEADALRPNSAYSGNLYSEEYFAMVKGRLNRGGLAVSWAPTPRVVASFLNVFPHVLLVNYVLVGSEQPIDTDGATISARLKDRFTTDYYRLTDRDVNPLLQPVIDGQFYRYQPPIAGRSDLALNSDLFPRDEFGVPLTAASPKR